MCILFHLTAQYNEHIDKARLFSKKGEFSIELLHLVCICFVLKRLSNSFLNFILSFCQYIVVLKKFDNNRCLKQKIYAILNTIFSNSVNPSTELRIIYTKTGYWPGTADFFHMCQSVECPSKLMGKSSWRKSP